MGNNTAKASRRQQEAAKSALVTTCEALTKAIVEVAKLEDGPQTEAGVATAAREVVKICADVAEKTAREMIKNMRAEKLKLVLAAGAAGGRDNTSRDKARLAEKLQRDLLVLELMRIALSDASGSGSDSGSSGGNRSGGGNTIAHPWTRKDDLGKGAFGSVYSAVDKNGLKFAVKEVPKHGVEEKSLRDEVKLLGNLAHRNIVQFYGCAGDKEKFYMYMELMQGSVRDIIEKSGKPVPEAFARKHTRDMLQGLIYLHGTDMIHRDIKCANVLLTSGGTAKLADMGISKKHDHATMIGPSDDKAGTIPWMSPEVLGGNEGGKRSDIWSVGCTVYEMVKGKAPFMEGLHPVLIAMILPRMILGIGHRKLVSDDDDLGPALKNFLMRIFVKMDERQFAEEVAKHPWVKT